MSNPRTHDLTGNRYGMLVVQSQSVVEFRGKRQSVCRCLCDCGKEVSVPASALERRDGTAPRHQRTSCGCKRRVEDLSGRRLGILTVLRKSVSTPKGGTMYTCRCDCGSVKDIAAYQLAGGEVKSCGCLLAAAQNSIYDRAGTSALEKSHTPEAEKRRINTRFGDPGSLQRKAAADALKQTLEATCVQIDGTNVPALIHTHPQGSNPYRGVCWNKRKNTWMAYCRVRNKSWSKCGFRTPEEAKAARDDAQEKMIAAADLKETIEKRKAIEKKEKTS